MAVLNTFMKKRIQQLIEETDNPVELFRQLDEVTSSYEDEERAALLEYAMELWLSAPHPGLEGHTPQEMLNMMLAQENGEELPPEKAQMLDQMIERAEEVQEMAEEEAIKPVMQKLGKSMKGIASKKIKVSSYTKQIESLPLTSDISAFLKYIKEKNGIESGKSNHTLTSKTVTDICNLLKKSPFVSFKGKPNPDLDRAYPEFMISMMMTAKLVGIKKNQIVIQKAGEEFLEGKNIPDSYVEFFKGWFLNLHKKPFWPEDAVDVFTYNTEIFPHRMLYGVYQAGKQWQDNWDAIIPVLGMIDDNTQEILDNWIEMDVNFFNLLTDMERFYDFDLYPLEILGCIEKKNRKKLPDRVRLTDIGVFMLERVFSLFHPLCRADAIIQFIRAKAAYFDMIINHMPDMQDKLEESPAYEDLMENLPNLDMVYFDYMNIAADYSNDRNRLEAMAEGLASFKDEFMLLIEDIKSEIKFNTAINKFRKLEIS